MEQYGFKVFLKGLKNRYGYTFEVGRLYLVNGPISWGNRGNGFHFCKNLEDCLRYFDSQTEEIEVAVVRGFGQIKKQDDEYFGYYDMFVSEGIDIIRVLTREEIIEYMLATTEDRQLRFIEHFNLTDEEKLLFETEKLDNARKNFRF